MKIKVKLFAAARDAVGADEVAVQLPEPATLDDLRRSLVQQHPQLASLAPHALFSVDAEYAAPHTRLGAGAEVACIPPVSGG